MREVPVTTPDGRRVTLTFPDGTSDEVVERVIVRDFMPIPRSEMGFPKIGEPPPAGPPIPAPIQSERAPFLGPAGIAPAPKPVVDLFPEMRRREPRPIASPDMRETVPPGPIQSTLPPLGAPDAEFGPVFGHQPMPRAEPGSFDGPVEFTPLPPSGMPPGFSTLRLSQPAPVDLPPEPAYRQAIEDPWQTGATPGSFEQLKRSTPKALLALGKRVGGDLGAGAVNVASTTMRGVDWLADSSRARDAATYLDNLSKRISPDDPDFLDEAINGFGSTVLFYVPGWAVGAGARAVSSIAPRISNWLGVGTMGGLESFSEAGGAFQDTLEKTKDREKAGKVATKTFWMNVPVTTLTDKLAFFNEGAVADVGAKLLARGGGEAFQEGTQEAIPSIAAGEPVDWPRVGKAAAVGGLAALPFGAADVIGAARRPTRAETSEAKAAELPPVQAQQGRPGQPMEGPGGGRPETVGARAEAPSQPVDLRKEGLKKAMRLGYEADVARSTIDDMTPDELLAFIGKKASARVSVATTREGLPKEEVQRAEDVRGDQGLPGEGRQEREGGGEDRRSDVQPVGEGARQAGDVPVEPSRQEAQTEEVTTSAAQHWASYRAFGSEKSKRVALKRWGYASEDDLRRAAEAENRHRAETEEPGPIQGPKSLAETERDVALEAAEKARGTGPELTPEELAGAQRKRKGFDLFMERTLKQWAREAKGQEILDNLEDTGTAPMAVADRFWTQTYWDLDSRGQEFFRKQWEAHHGMDFQSPKDARSTIDLPPTVDSLEGTERGFVAQMAEANRMRDQWVAAGGEEVKPQRPQPARLEAPGPQAAPQAAPGSTQPEPRAEVPMETAAPKEEAPASRPATFRAFVESRGEKWPLGPRTKKYKALKAEWDGMQGERPKQQTTDEMAREIAEEKTKKEQGGIQQNIFGGEEIGPAQKAVTGTPLFGGGAETSPAAKNERETKAKQREKPLLSRGAKTERVTIPHPRTLSKEILSRMDRSLKAMGYDSRGPADVRQMLIDRMAPGNELWHEDWIEAYRKAVGAEAKRETTRATKAEERASAEHVNWGRLRELGTTTDVREAGYITPKGTYVDLSGKKEGGPPGTRSYDHREAGGTSGMQEFMALGNIRMDANSGAIDITKEPTPEQYARIDALATRANGEIVLDLEDGLGEWDEGRGYYRNPERRFSREYPAGTKPARIRADIQRFFSGEKPLPLRSMASRRAPPWRSKLQDVWREKVQGPMPPDQLVAMLTKNGVKPDEMKWSGLDELVAQAKKEGRKIRPDEMPPMVEVREVVKGGIRPALSREQFDELPEEEQNRLADMEDATKFSQYQLPGGENYRELLLTLPDAEGVRVVPHPESEIHYALQYPDGSYVVNPPDSVLPGAIRGWGSRELAEGSGIRSWDKTNYRSSHWDEPNVLAHVRFNDRTGPNGEKILFLEEVQSDLHQEGRRKGYKRPLGAEERAEMEALRRRANRPRDELTDAETARYHRLWAADVEEAVPDAPFAKTWPELAFKRMVRYGAENGYQAIAWTTGEQQAERYDLSKQIDSLAFHKNRDGTVALTAMKDGRDVLADDYRPEQLPDVIGKELADRIVQDERTSGTLSGLDLKVGGEGMKGFYDSILPKAADKLGKKWGAKTGTVNFDTGFSVTRPSGETRVYETQEMARASSVPGWKVKKSTTTVHALPITDAMRRSVLEEGQYLFRKTDEPLFSPGKDEPAPTKGREDSWDDEMVSALREASKAIRSNFPLRIVVAGSIMDTEHSSMIDALEDTDPLKSNPFDLKGLFTTDPVPTAYVFTFPHESPAAAVRTLAHEVVGHFGPEVVLTGKDFRTWRRMLGDLYERGPESLKADIHERGYPDATEEDRIIFAKEMIATASEQQRQIPRIRALLDWIREKLQAWIAKVTGTRPRITNTQIQRFVNRVAGEVTRGDVPATFTDARESVAPEGSRLEEMGYFARSVNTESEAFKKWFRESKVVDENGEPLVVYHGTDRNFYAFDAAELGKNTAAKSAKEGFFFATNPEVAAFYPVYSSDVITPYFLNQVAEESARQIEYAEAIAAAREAAGEDPAAPGVRGPIETAKNNLRDFARYLRKNPERKAWAEEWLRRAEAIPLPKMVPTWGPNAGKGGAERGVVEAWEKAARRVVDVERETRRRLDYLESITDEEWPDRQMEIVEAKEHLATVKAQEDRARSTLLARVGTENMQALLAARKALRGANKERKRANDQYSRSQQEWSGGNEEDVWEGKEETTGYLAPNVMPVHLRIENPLVINYATELEDKPFTSVVQEAKAKGHDGALLKNTRDPYLSDVWIAFEPTQIKSVFNRGTWAPNDPRVLFSRKNKGEKGLVEKNAEDARKFTASTGGRLSLFGLGPEKRPPVTVPKGSSLQSADPEVEKRYRAAKGLGKQGIVAKIRAAGIAAKKDATRAHFATELDPKTDGALIDALRIYNQVPSYSKAYAADRIARFIRPLDAQAYDVFTRNVILPDIAKDIEAGLYQEGEEGWSLPFGYASPEALEQDIANFERIADANPEIRKALDARNAFVKKLGEDMVDTGLLDEKSLEGDRYFHHQVLAYMAAGGADGKSFPRVSSKDVRTHRKGFQIARKGSSLDFNTDYIEAEFEWMAQAVSQIETVRTIERLRDITDIKPKLDAQAKIENLYTVHGGRENYLRLMNLRARIAELQESPDAKESDVRAQLRALHEEADPLDVLKPFRQKKAIAKGRVAKMAAAGQLNDAPESLQGAVAGLAEEAEAQAAAKEGEAFFPPARSLATDNDFFGLLNWLASQEGERALPARMFWKAVQDEKAFVRETAGASFKTWQDLVPEDFVAWQPKQGTRFYRTMSLPERIITKLLEEGTGEVSAEDLRSVLAVGGPLPQYVIPERLAVTLDNFRDYKDEGALAAASMEIMTAWKRWTLLNPTRALRYMLNNASGDLDITLASYPAALKHAAGAAKDLRRYVIKHEAASEEILEALRLGVIDSGITVHEIPDIKSAEVMRQIRADDNASMWEKIWGTYWDKVSGWNTWREGTLRLAMWRYLKEQMGQGKKLYGASKKSEVDAIADVNERAAKVARELIGDYGAVSKLGEYMRRRVVPFYSWQEINAPRYVRLIQNVQHEDASSAGRKARVAAVVGKRAAGKAAKVAVKNSARLLIGGSALYVMANLWNRTFFPDEEEELGKARHQLHIILGRAEDGTIRSIRLQGALSDALGWFGLEDLPGDVQAVLGKKRTVAEQGWQMATAAAERLGLAAFPVHQMVGEAITGRKLYPSFISDRPPKSMGDVFETRPVRDRLEHVANFWSLGGAYRKLRGRPSRGLWDDVSGALVYTTDPGQQAYYEVREMVSRFREDNNIETPSMEPTARQNALYYHKMAKRLKDKRAAARFGEEYVLLGGTPKGYAMSLERSAPLGPLPRELQRPFYKSLSAQDRALVDRASRWYVETYLAQ